MKKIILGLTLSAAMLLNTVAGELGMPAAPLKISEWVKGKPVDLAAAKGKQVVVVEFWATWCPPCRASIPHLTELQKKFKEVAFVGVTDEKSEVVKKFVAKMGEKMDYAVAIDENDATSQGYMREFGVSGIPHAFIVDKDSRIVWQGHPMDGLDVALEAVVAGKYDLAAEKAKAQKQAQAEAQKEIVDQKLQQLARLIVDGKEGEESKKLEAELVTFEKEQGGILDGEKFEPVEFRKRVVFSQKVQKYRRAVLSAAAAEEIGKLEQELTTDAPGDFNLKEFKAMLAAQLESKKASPILQSYFQAVGEEGNKEQAAELAKKVEALELKNPQLLNELAWGILTSENVKIRDLELATKLAKAAVAASQGTEAGIIDTYARALFDSGKVEAAIEQQRKAMEAATDDELKKELGETLKKYEQKAAPKQEGT